MAGGGIGLQSGRGRTRPRRPGRAAACPCPARGRGGSGSAALGSDSGAAQSNHCHPLASCCFPRISGEDLKALSLAALKPLSSRGLASRVVPRGAGLAARAAGTRWAAPSPWKACERGPAAQALIDINGRPRRAPTCSVLRGQVRP